MEGCRLYDDHWQLHGLPLLSSTACGMYDEACGKERTMKAVLMGTTLHPGTAEAGSFKSTIAVYSRGTLLLYFYISK